MTINLTAPANHPANKPLPVQRIERVIEALKQSIQYQNGGDMAYVIADAIKGLEELLVSRKGDEPTDDERIMEIEGITPPAPCTIPTQSSNDVNDAAWKLHDMLTEHGPLNGYQFNNLKVCFYEALKVAMRNSPVTPDGWQLVPKEPTEAMNKAGWAAMNEHDAI
ncbi:TPA: hypothetical protein ACJIK4_004650, partial [Kluyvera cryocrescens]